MLQCFLQQFSLLTNPAVVPSGGFLLIIKQMIRETLDYFVFENRFFILFFPILLSPFICRRHHHIKRNRIRLLLMFIFLSAIFPVCIFIFFGLLIDCFLPLGIFLSIYLCDLLRGFLFLPNGPLSFFLFTCLFRLYC